MSLTFIIFGALASLPTAAFALVRRGEFGARQDAVRAGGFRLEGRRRASAGRANPRLDSATASRGW